MRTAICFFVLTLLITSCSLPKRHNEQLIQKNDSFVSNLSGKEVVKIIDEGQDYLELAQKKKPLTQNQKIVLNKLIRVLCWATGNVYLDMSDIEFGDYESSNFQISTGKVRICHDEFQVILVLLHELAHAADREKLVRDNLATELRAHVSVLRAHLRIAKKCQKEVFYSPGLNRYPIGRYYAVSHVFRRVNGLGGSIGDYFAPNAEQRAKLIKTIDKVKSYKELREWLQGYGTKWLQHELSAFSLFFFEAEFERFEDIAKFVKNCDNQGVINRVNAILGKRTITQLFKLFYQKRKARFKKAANVSWML